MNALWLWMRRGVGLTLLPTIVAFLGVSSLGNRAWSLDADWGLRYTAGAIILFAPLVAAVVAYDTARKLAPGLAVVGRGSVRGQRAGLLPMFAAVAWAVIATSLSWLVIIAVVARSGGVPPSDPWVWAEMASVYLAAGAIGALVGSRVPTVVAVALSAGAVFVLASLLGSQGIKALQVAMSTGTMIGLERTPARAALAISVNLAVALCAAAATVLLARPRQPRPWMIAAAAVPAALAVAVHLAFPFQDSEYRPTRAPLACWGSAPALCGPSNAAPLLIAAQRDLAAARDSLEASGLPLPSTFSAVRPDRYTTIGTAAPLTYDPSALVDGHLSREAVAQALAMPRLCSALFSEASAPEYLALVSTSATWIDASLKAGSRAAAPPQVADAYDRLANCHVPTPDRR
jgi:hypothetical protein